MKQLTAEETTKVYEIIRNTRWVHEQVNRELSTGKEWNLIMFQVAEAFNIVER